MTSARSIRLSCEFFPTATAQGAENLSQVRKELEVLNCDYYSVTYGAGGSTQERTFQLVERICQEGKRPVMPHLTCISASKAQLEEILDRYQSLNIKRLMALRGDMPAGNYYHGELNGAADLVRLARKKWGDDAHIMVAAYPEKHPRARTPREDLLHFKSKCEAGANEAITQYFYNVDAFLRFRDECRAINLNVPLIPGIMPISNYKQLARFSDACGAELPRWIRKRLEAYQNEPSVLLEFGIEVVASLCERLNKEGVCEFHFYTMNRADIILSIVRRLGWIQ